MTNLQACRSFRRLVSPITGILGIKKSAPSKKHKQTVSSDASQTKQTPSKSSICALYLAILIQKLGLLSVRYRTNRQVTPKAGIYEGNGYYIRVDWTGAGQVLDLIKAAPQAALQKLGRCRYFRLAA